jgi:hypothetical protein
VRVPSPEEVVAFQLGDRIVAVLAEKYPGVTLEQADFVDPAVGEELREAGVLRSCWGWL